MFYRTPCHPPNKATAHKGQALRLPFIFLGPLLKTLFHERKGKVGAPAMGRELCGSTQVAAFNLTSGSAAIR